MLEKLKYSLSSNKGFTLSEVLFSILILTLLFGFYFQVENAIDNLAVLEIQAIEQMFQLETALNIIEELLRRSDELSLLNKTSRYSQGIRLTYKENGTTKVATFRLEYHTGIVSETIQVNNNTGTSQLAIDIEDLEFTIEEHSKGRVLKAKISGKKDKFCILERSYYLRGMGYG